VSRIRRFFAEAWQELKKVTWPTPEQARNLTVMVIAISFIVGMFITVCDLGFSAVAKALNAG
jgi:preprotein translocase SecE subunit